MQKLTHEELIARALAPVVPAEEASKVEVSDTLKAFRARAKEENARMQNACDSEYWAAICFDSQKTKNEFLDALGIRVAGDKYIDGRLLAKALKIKLSAPEYVPKLGKKRPKLVDEVGFIV